MKISMILLVVFFVICGCKEELSDLEKAKIDQEVNEQLKDIFKEVYLDTTGIANSPVQVLSAEFVKEEYSTYRNIRLKYKNVSTKTIEAIRFEWYGENSFGEIADNGRGYGSTDERLKPNKTRSSTWTALSRDGKKILLAKANEVVFSDGTKWKLKDN